MAEIRKIKTMAGYIKASTEGKIFRFEDTALRPRYVGRLYQVEGASYRMLRIRFIDNGEKILHANFSNREATPEEVQRARESALAQKAQSPKPNK